jgi:hypothetical protein
VGTVSDALRCAALHCRGRRQHCFLGYPARLAAGTKQAGLQLNPLSAFPCCRYDGYSPQLSRVLRFHRSYGRHMPK